MTPPDPLTLARELRALADAATPGEWVATTRHGSWDWLIYCKSDPNFEICQMFHDGTDYNEVGEANASFVAASRLGVPALCDAVEDLVGQKARADSKIADLCISYGGAHAALTRAGVPTENATGEILESDKRIDMLAKERDALRATLEQVAAVAKVMRKSNELTGPVEYEHDQRAMRVWQKTRYTIGRELWHLIRAALGGKP